MASRELCRVLNVLGSAVLVRDSVETRSEQERSRVLSVGQLLPDPAQPRRLLPEDLREKLLSGASPVGVLWESWRRCLGDRLYQMVRSHVVNPKEALARRRADGVRDLALHLNLEGETMLAESIGRHGLRHPIDVYRIDRRHYQIVDGERRWWAHLHLRYLLLRHEFSTIRAQVQPLPDDAGEMSLKRHAQNVHRSDLSAVARARALHSVEELLREEHLVAAAPPGDSLGHGRDEACGRMHRRRAWNKRISRRLQEMTGKGMSARKLRHFRGLLTLPPEAQALAEAADLSERSLRPVVSLDDCTQQARLVHTLALGEMTPAEAEQEVRRLIGKEEPTEDTMRDVFSGDLCSSFRFPDGALPDPSDLAAEMAQLPFEEQARLQDEAHRLLFFLQSFLDAGSTEA